MRVIVFYIFGLLDSVHTGYMTPFPAVFTLWYSRVHICTMNCSNKAANVKPPINETLSFGAALYVPYIDPDDRHVQLGRYLDDSWFKG